MEVLSRVAGTAADLLAPQPRPAQHRLGKFGTSEGIDACPVAVDDGWSVPPPVRLSDGTRLQLYKDGEALLAAFQAIKGARLLV